MIACALIPRLSLTSALGGRRGMVGRPLALAPQPGGPQVVGEVSGTAEAHGVRAGMRLGEALSRCPSLVLVAADPVRAEAAWEESLRRLETIGAAVEPAQPGEAYFALEPLRGIHGEPGVILARARRALGAPARLGAGPNRISARAAAMRMRARRPPLLLSDAAARRMLAGLPVAALRGRLAQGGWRALADHDAPGSEAEEASCIDCFERLGVRTLGELAGLPAEAIADRFGDPGLRALELARGADEPLRPRRVREQLAERLELPEAASGQQLERALGLLAERLLSHPSRGGRTIRKLRIEARLAAGGGWRTDVTMRTATAGAERLRLALAPRLLKLPGPAAALALRALELGPPGGEQAALASPTEERRARLGEAVRQTRAAAGRDAVLKVLEVDPHSRIPERRAILTPFGERADD